MIIVLLMPVGLMFSAGPALAHGTSHPGRHSEATTATHGYLDFSREPGTFGLGYFTNTCTFVMHVKYQIMTEQFGCHFRLENPYPCLLYVPAEGTTLSYLGTEGDVKWVACRAEDEFFGPWLHLVRVSPDGSATYNCFHASYGPNGEDNDHAIYDVVGLRRAQEAKDAARRQARHEENQRRYQRTKRKIEQLKERQDARRERNRLQREQRQERREQRQRERDEDCSYAVIDGVRISCGMN